MCNFKYLYDSKSCAPSALRSFRTAIPLRLKFRSVCLRDSQSRFHVLRIPPEPRSILRPMKDGWCRQRMGRRMVDDPAATGSGKNLELSLHGYELDPLVVRSIDSRRSIRIRPIPTIKMLLTQTNKACRQVADVTNSNF